MKRERPTPLVEHILRSLDGGQSEWPLSLVTDLYVFGSFALGALGPHDVDIDIGSEPDRDWGAHFAGCLSYGKNPFTVFKRRPSAPSAAASFSSNSRAAPTSR